MYSKEDRLILKTEFDEIVLSSLKVEHLENYSKYASNIKIWNLFRDEFPNPYTIEDAKNYFESVKDKNTHFAILFKNKLIGDIHIGKQEDILRKSGMIGYWLAEPYWGRGYMTACIKVITDYSFSKLDINRIFARVFANNVGSKRALEKAGFYREGKFKMAVFKNNEYLDQLQYAKLASN